MKKSRSKDYREFLEEEIRDPKEAELYLKASLDEYEESKNLEAFLLALKTVTKVHCGFTKLAEQTDLSRESLYRTLSNKGNPRLTTLDAILNALGYRLSIEPLRKAA